MVSVDTLGQTGGATEKHSDPNAASSRLQVRLEGKYVPDPHGLARGQCQYVAYVVYEMDEDATEEEKENIISEWEEEAIEELYSEWEEDSEIEIDEDVLSTITIDINLYPYEETETESESETEDEEESELESDTELQESETEVTETESEEG